MFIISVANRPQGTFLYTIPGVYLSWYSFSVTYAVRNSFDDFVNVLRVGDVNLYFRMNG